MRITVIPAAFMICFVATLPAWTAELPHMQMSVFYQMPVGVTTVNECREHYAKETAYVDAKLARLCTAADVHELWGLGLVYKDQYRWQERACEMLAKKTRMKKPKTSIPIGTALRTTGPSLSNQSTVKPAAKGGSNASMDRLSGDNQLPTATNPDSKGGSRSPASGGASAVAKPGTPSALPKPDPTIDFGKCANCGKPSSSTR